MHHITPGAPGSLKIAKAQAKRLRTALNASSTLTSEIVHGQALELIAKTHGFESWGHLVAAVPDDPAAETREPFPARDLTRVEPDWPASAVFSLGHLIRSIESVSMRRKVSAPMQQLAALFVQVAKTLPFRDSPENRMVRQLIGLDISGLTTLIRGDQIPDLLRWFGAVCPEAMSLIEAGMNDLHLNLDPGRGTDIGLFPLDLPVTEAQFLTSHDPERQAEFRDRRHTVIVAPHLTRARDLGRIIDPDLLDLTGSGPDTDRLLAAFGLGGIRITHPLDALIWASALVLGATLATDGAAPPRKSLTVLVRGSDLRWMGDSPLLQARSLNVHVCVWADDETEEDWLRTRLVPKLYRCLRDIGDGTGQVVGDTFR